MAKFKDIEDKDIEDTHLVSLKHQLHYWEMKIDQSLSDIWQILRLNLFEKTPL